LSDITRSTVTPRWENRATARVRNAAALAPRSSGRHLDVGEPGRVVDADVDKVPADQPAASAGGGALAGAAALMAGHTLARPAEAAQLLDVDMHALARP
jgi:hypothetical protein